MWYVSEMTVSRSDSDGDGRADLVCRNTSTGEISIWLMDDVSRKKAAISLRTADPDWKLAGLADFSGDEKMGLLWRNTATGKNYV